MTKSKAHLDVARPQFIALEGDGAAGLQRRQLLQGQALDGGRHAPHVLAQAAAQHLRHGGKVCV